MKKSFPQPFFSLGRSWSYLTAKISLQTAVVSLRRPKELNLSSLGVWWRLFFLFAAVSLSRLEPAVSMLLFLHAHHRKKRDRVSGCAEEWPESQWLHGLMMKHCGSVALLRRADGVLPDTWENGSVVEITRGHEYAGALTPWSTEGQCLWNYFGQSLASFSVQVKRQVSLTNTTFPMPSRIARMLWSPASLEMDARDMEVLWQAWPRDLVEAFLAKPLVLSAPGACAALIERHAWHTIMLNAEPFLHSAVCSGRCIQANAAMPWWIPTCGMDPGLLGVCMWTLKGEANESIALTVKHGSHTHVLCTFVIMGDSPGWHLRLLRALRHFLWCQEYQLSNTKISGWPAAMFTYHAHAMKTGPVLSGLDEQPELQKMFLRLQ